MLNKKIANEIAIGIILILAIIVGGIFYWQNQKSVQQPEQRACTMEAKLCNDGSYVSRTGPNCEFTPCPEKKSTQMANPASTYCVENGGKSEIRTATDGSQTGYCKFDDGSECEEWAFFRKECNPGGIDSISDKIIVNSPIANAIIHSPITISGQARGTWFFEGSFPVEIYDSNNKLLGSSVVNFNPKSATDTWMTENFVDFEGEIKFSQSTTASGYLLFKKDNPSGNPELDESMKLMIKFK